MRVVLDLNKVDVTVISDALALYRSAQRDEHKQAVARGDSNPGRFTRRINISFVLESQFQDAAENSELSE